MKSELPQCIALSAWLNAWRAHRVTSSDCANAAESITGFHTILIDAESTTWLDFLGAFGSDRPRACPALPAPGHPHGVPISALGSALNTEGFVGFLNSGLVTLSPDRMATYSDSVHSIPVVDLHHARQAFRRAISESTKQLVDLNVLGNRELADSSVSVASFLHLPPADNGRHIESVHQAFTIAQVCNFALEHSSVVASRSADAERISILTTLRNCAYDVMYAVAIHYA